MAAPSTSFICDECKAVIQPGEYYSHKLDRKGNVIADKFKHVPPTRCRKKSSGGGKKQGTKNAT